MTRMLSVLLCLCTLSLVIQASHIQGCPDHCRCDASLQHLNCSDSHLTNIQQLSLPTESLVSLMLDHNSLTALPASSMNGARSLQFLAANNNNISYLGNGSLCAKNSLLHLFVEYNHISWIEEDYLKDCHLLRTLELRSNYLYVEDVAYLLQSTPQLETLDLSNNQFYNDTDLPYRFQSLKKLKYFYIDEMQEIRHIGPGFFLYLNTSLFEEFSLARNLISHISNETFANMPNLHLLDVSQTMISQQNLRAIFSVLGQNSYSLKKLIMQSIFVYRGTREAIDHHFFKHLNGTSLRVLHAERNFAGFHGKLERATLAGLHHLQELYLDENELHWIHAKAFSHLSHLKVLSLKHNLLSCAGGCDFLSHTLPELRMLKLSNNAIDNSLEEVLFHDSGLPKLRHLALDRNKLKMLNPLTFILSTLHSLDISENPISSIETGTFSAMSELRILKMDYCIHLHNLVPKVFAGLYKLETLTLNHNTLSRLDKESWFGLQALKHLELSHNMLGGENNTLDLNIPCGNLSQLDLSYNNIRAILLPDIKIDSLLLKQNKLTTLSDISYSQLNRVQHLDVSYNYLHTVSEDSLDEIKDINIVDLEGNPLYCDCDAMSLKDWLQAKNSNLTCFGPKDKLGLAVTQADLCPKKARYMLPLMITFLLLFLLVSLILVSLIFCSGLSIKDLLKPSSNNTDKSQRSPGRNPSIQTREEDTELKESLSGSNHCLNLNYCLSSEEVETTSNHSGRQPLIFYSQDVHSTV